MKIRVEHCLLALALTWSLSHVQLAYLSSLDHFLRDITTLSDWMFLLNQQSRTSQAIAEANSHLSQHSIGSPQIMLDYVTMTGEAE